LHISEILAWADAHHRLTGQWPARAAGTIVAAPWDTWQAVDMALKSGRRGLRDGSSLARFLAKYRGRRNKHALPHLSTSQILSWADAHQRRTGSWPAKDSGPISTAPGETWQAVEMALRNGRRGLRGSSSLAGLLAKCRGRRNKQALPHISVSQILSWADAHHRRTGTWPAHDNGPIAGVPGETWGAVQSALTAGLRGLPGGSSLVKLLARHHRKRNRLAPPRLAVPQILAWADQHRQRTGKWPTDHAGPIPTAPGESWGGVEHALKIGRRGLSGGSSIGRLLAQYGRKLNLAAQPPFTLSQILAWADAHHERTGRWPAALSGPIPEQPGENWNKVAMALYQGGRGLPGGDSLAQVLLRYRGVRRCAHRPRLTVKQILRWAKAHYRRTGHWPQVNSGAIPEAPDNNWNSIDAALTRGSRGLPAGLSLRKLLVQQRGFVGKT
jgi:hypothetical protein